MLLSSMTGFNLSGTKVQDFAGTLPQIDDMTLVVVRVLQRLSIDRLLIYMILSLLFILSKFLCHHRSLT